MTSHRSNQSNKQRKPAAKKTGTRAGKLKSGRQTAVKRARADIEASTNDDGQHDSDETDDCNDNENGATLEEESPSKGTDNEDGDCDGSAESNEILPDVPLSGELDHRWQQNSKFMSNNYGGDDSRGRKDRPFSIDISDEEVGAIGNKANMKTLREQSKDALHQKQESNIAVVKVQSNSETTNSKGSSQDFETKCEPGCDESKLGADDDGDEEIKIIRETGKNPLSDFAHPRYDCVMKPFDKDPEAFCPNCYCYVCDVKASECDHWKINGENEDDFHCYAESSIIKWKRRRSRLRNKRKRPQRALQQIAIFLPDTIPTELPSKRRTRETVRFGQPGYESNSDVRRALLPSRSSRRQRKTR